MKRKTVKLFTGMLSMLCACSLSAQEANRIESENYTQGLTALENDSLELAMTYFAQELEEHPDNGYAYAHMAVIQYRAAEYGNALAAVNEAIESIPLEDKEYRSYIYVTRAHVYLQLADTTQALCDLEQAIQNAPDESRLYETRAQLYYDQGNYAQSDADYQRMIDLDESDAMGYMGLGRNAKAQALYEEAIRQFDYVNKLYPNYDQPYAFRSDCYIAMKRYDLALDDVICALDLDHGDKAFYNLLLLADSAFTLTVNRLKVQKMKKPEAHYFAYDLGVIHERAKKYREAIPYYEESFALDDDADDAYRLAHCYNQLGDFDSALRFCDQAILLDAEENRYLHLKACLLDHMGRSEEAILAMSECIAREPDQVLAYYTRGWFEEHTGKSQAAIDDFTMSITLDPTYAYAYLNRGVIYMRMGEQARAEEDFRRVIALETEPEKAECAFYAYYYLGDKGTAITWLNKVLEKGDEGDYYDAACLYAEMGEQKKALNYLRESLHRGFRRFAHIRRDRMLDNIRNLPALEELLKEYEEKHKKEIKDCRMRRENVMEHIAIHFLRIKARDLKPFTTFAAILMR